MKKRNLWWWLFISWWYYPLIWWWIKPLKLYMNHKKKMNKLPVSFDVVGTYYYKNDITNLLSNILPNQWQGKNFSSYKTYQFEVLDEYKNVDLVPEKDNEHDKNAIKVLVDNILVGYVSKDINLEIIHYIGKTNAVAKIYGGDAKYKDGMGDIVKTEGDYNIIVTLYK